MVFCQVCGAFQTVAYRAYAIRPCKRRKNQNRQFFQSTTKTTSDAGKTMSYAGKIMSDIIKTTSDLFFAPCNVLENKSLRRFVEISVRCCATMGCAFLWRNAQNANARVVVIVGGGGSGWRGKAAECQMPNMVSSRRLPVAVLNTLLSNVLIPLSDTPSSKAFTRKSASRSICQSMPSTLRYV